MNYLRFISLFAICNLFPIIICYSLPTVSDTLINPRLIELSDGYIVYGLKTNKSENNFLAIKYSKSLVKTNQYFKAIKSNGRFSINFIQDINLVFEINENSKNNTGYIIRLNENLNEVSFDKYSNEDFKKCQILRKNKNIFNYCPTNETLINNCFVNNLFIELSQDSLNNDTLRNKQISLKIKRPVVRAYAPLLQQYWSCYTVKWQTELKHNSIDKYKFCCTTNEAIYLYVNDKSFETGGQYIYKLNAITGQIIYQTKLKIDKLSACLYSNCYLNNSSGNLIVAGNYITPTDTNRISKLLYKSAGGYFFISINNEGKILKHYKSHPFLTCTSGDRSSVLFDFRPDYKNQIRNFQKIILTKENDYLFVGENFGIKCSSASSKNINYETILFSTDKLDQSLNFRDEQVTRYNYIKYNPKSIIKKKHYSSNYEDILVSNNRKYYFVDFTIDTTKQIHKLLIKLDGETTLNKGYVYYMLRGYGLSRYRYVGVDAEALAHGTQGISIEYFVKSPTELLTFSVDTLRNVYFLKLIEW